MGVDGDKADIFDEYFDDDKSKITNFEKIKAMDIDGMADYLFLLQNGRICGCSECKNSECNDLMLAELPYEHLCKNFIKQWLESEVRE